MARPKLKRKFKKRPLNLTIRPEILKDAKWHADYNGVSLSQLIEHLLLEHMKESV